MPERLDAFAGAMDYIDRKTRREQAIEEALRSVFHVASDPDVDVDDVSHFLSEQTQGLIEALDKIDTR